MIFCNVARPIFLTPKFRPEMCWELIEPSSNEKRQVCGTAGALAAKAVRRRRGLLHADYVYIYIICVCTVRYCISVYLYICTLSNISIYTPLCLSLSLSLSLPLSIYIYKCTYMYLCTYIPISTNSYKHVFPQSLLVPSCSARHRHLSCRQVSVKCHNWRPVWFWTFMSHFPWKPGSTGSWVSWVLLSDDGVLPDL